MSKAFRRFLKIKILGKIYLIIINQEQKKASLFLLFLVLIRSFVSASISLDLRGKDLEMVAKQSPPIFQTSLCGQVEVKGFLEAGFGGHGFKLCF